MHDEAAVRDSVSRIIAKDGRYEVNAYLFVLNVIDFLHHSMEERRHMSGEEVLDGVRIHASSQFGPMAKQVLNSWGLETTGDIGAVVFNLIGAGLLEKTEQDSVDDFSDVFDFREVFEEDYFRS